MKQFSFIKWNKGKALFVVAIIIGCAFIFGVDASQQHTYEEIRLAYVAIDNGHYEEAANVFSAYLDAHNIKLYWWLVEKINGANSPYTYHNVLEALENCSKDIVTACTLNLSAYCEVISDYNEEDIRWAFVRIVGSNIPVLLITENFFELEEYGKVKQVAINAQAYAIIDEEICCLGSVQSSMAYPLSLDQMGYLYSVTDTESVIKWAVDKKEKKLIEYEKAHKEENTYKYYSILTGKTVEQDSESRLQDLHFDYGDSSPIYFDKLPVDGNS